MHRILGSFLLAVFGIGVSAAPLTPSVIRAVKVDRQTLNVAARDTVTISALFSRPGRVSIVVIDRDGYPVRTLAKEQSVKDSFNVGWDGRADAGEFVADEAYSLKIDWKGSGKAETYFPANTPQPITAIEPRAYSRRSATLSYVLPQPSRVHIQAGTAAVDPITEKPTGPVMKTVVNREPRIGGAIAEHWSGFDESGLVFLPDLPDFVVAIAATPLPENSIITFGNRERSFVETIAMREGASLLSHRKRGDHHGGLTTADDVSPELAIEPLNATWSPAERAWIPEAGKPLHLKLTVRGPTADAFRKQPATIEIFLDGKRLGDAATKHSDVVDVPLDLATGIRRLSVNWNNDWGPVAANTIQVLASRDAARQGATR